VEGKKILNFCFLKSTLLQIILSFSLQPNKEKDIVMHVLFPLNFLSFHFHFFQTAPESHSEGWKGKEGGKSKKGSERGSGRSKEEVREGFV